MTRNLTMHISALHLRLAVLFGVALLCGCGKTDSAPMAYQRIDLVGKALSAMSAEDYPAAASAVTELRKNESENDFLIRTQRMMTANAAMKSAKDLIDKHRYAGALVIIREEIASNGPTKNLVASAATLNDLIMIRTLAEASRRATTTESLIGVIERLKKTLTERPELASELTPLLRDRMIFFRHLERAEESKARLDMWFDLDAELAVSGPYRMQMLAELQAAAPHMNFEKLYHLSSPKPLFTHKEP